MNRRVMLLVAGAALAVGCGSKDKDKDEGGGSAKVDPPPADHDMATEVFSKDLKTVTSRVGATDLSIDLPEAASAPNVGTDAVTFEFKDSALKLTVTPRAVPIAADELMKKKEILTDGSQVLLRADQPSGDSFIVSKKAKHNTWFTMELCRNIPAGSLCCAASLNLDKPFMNGNFVLNAAEHVCRSLTIAGEPHPAPIPRADMKKQMRRPPG